MSPRSLLVSVSLLATALTASAAEGFKAHLGLQLYSLRDYFKTDALAGLDQAKATGLVEMEIAGTANLTAEQFRAALEERGMKAISAHVQFPAMEKDLDGVIRSVQALGAKYAICPWIPHQGEFDAAAVKRAAESFNQWGAAFRAAGIRFGYHPHGYEFVPGDTPGLTRFDELAAATSPENVCFQLDVYWAYVGGADPVALLEKYGSRWVSLHVKDVRKGVERAPGKSGTAPEDKVIVGTGQIDWKAVLRAAQKAGVTQYIIEDESPDPVGNIPPSVAYLRQLEL